MSSPPRKKEKKEEEFTRLPPDGFILFEVEKVSTLSREERYSSEVYVRGVSWKASIMYDTDLYVDLYCMSTQSVPWKIDVDVETTLVHTDSKKNSIDKHHRSFKPEELNMYVFLRGWDEFIEDRQGFIKDDKITVEVRFWIANMRGVRTVPRIDFTDPDDSRHDVALMIGGEKIYASKQILAAHSPMFTTMFYGCFTEKNKKVIELKDVDREEFLEMLRVIYPSNKQIDYDSAEYLLKLGDQFQMARVIDRVEKFLIDSCFSNNDKMRISDKFKLFELQEHCFSKLKTDHTFNELKDSSIYRELSLETKALLFESILITVRGTAGNLPAQAAGYRTLKSFNNTYICAERGPTGNVSWYVDLSHHYNFWVQWHIVERNGKVMLRAYVHKFLRAHPDCRVDLADEAREWEMWTPCKNGDGTWSFRSHHGTWLSAHRADGIVCTKRHKSKGEKFRLESWE